MRKTNSKKLVLRLGSGLACIALVALFLFISSSNQTSYGQVLTETEMAAVFGDAPGDPGTDPCVFKSLCYKAFRIGSSDC